MEHLTIPQGYVSPLTIRETEVAIKEIKDYFERSLAKSLHLTRVSAPLFVKPESGLNDNLNGVERPVSFGIKEQEDTPAEIVHSLAKWKRYALKHYGFHSGEGLYTDMSAIRRDEDTDNIHSIYVDQWDWEKVISKEERNMETLQYTVHSKKQKIIFPDGITISSRCFRTISFLSHPRSLKTCIQDVTPRKESTGLPKKRERSLWHRLEKFSLQVKSMTDAPRTMMTGN